MTEPSAYKSFVECDMDTLTRLAEYLVQAIAKGVENVTESLIEIQLTCVNASTISFQCVAP